MPLTGEQFVTLLQAAITEYDLAFSAADAAWSKYVAFENAWARMYNLPPGTHSYSAYGDWQERVLNPTVFMRWTQFDETYGPDFHTFFLAVRNKAERLHVIRDRVNEVTSVSVELINQINTLINIANPKIRGGKQFYLNWTMTPTGHTAASSPWEHYFDLLLGVDVADFTAATAESVADTTRAIRDGARIISSATDPILGPIFRSRTATSLLLFGVAGLYLWSVLRKK